MIRLRRPDDHAIRQHLEELDGSPSYDEVGATRDEAALRADPAGYDIDHHRFALGHGHACYERAREALLRWTHFAAVPWLEFYGADRPAHLDQRVATLVRVAGLWFLNPCRVVYTDFDGSPNELRFAYGTLPGHVERGEERFCVRIDPETEEVEYELLAFSRPALLVTRAAYPWTRATQQRFARASGHAMQVAASAR